MTTIAWVDTPQFRYKQRNLQLLKERRNVKQEADARQRRRADPARWLSTYLHIYRYRAQQKEFEYNLTATDLIVPTHCPVLGIPIILGTGNKGMGNPNAPSVDRFDNTKGYTKENCRIISNRANLLKRDATIAELKAVLAYMEGG